MEEVAHRVTIWDGVTLIFDAEDNRLLTIQLTPISLIVRDSERNIILDIPRIALKWLDHRQKEG